MIGKTISHYRIVEELGRGGMGVVYKAEDTTLKRTVALKFLSPHLLTDENQKKRFLHEAQATAALDHPNIATVHEIQTSNDHTFMVMAFVEGESVGTRIESGPLPVAEVLDIAVQVARGLSSAHSRGIVHRDVKPGNVIVTPEGQVKVVDFGLAKLATQTQLTRTGTSVGTVRYMSPEQATGGAVDHRTDIWSLGVMLYEMLAGRLPFRGDVEQAIMYSVLNESPRPLTESRAEVPVALENIVERALAKDPEKRYSTMQAFLEDLEAQRDRVSLGIKQREFRRLRKLRRHRRLAGGLTAVSVAAAVAILFHMFYNPGTGIKSLAVLPFANLSGDDEQEYFSDGMTDMLINEVGQISAIRVISRTSVMRFKETEKSLQEIAEALGVDAVIEASVLRSGDRIRISARLMRPDPEELLWSENYNRDGRDVAILLSEVSRAIADRIEVALTPGETERLTQVQTVDPEAYDLYLKAEYYCRRYSGADLEHAMELYQGAIDIDPTYARAYAGLASAYVRYVFNAFGPPGDMMPLARAAANRALELDPSLAEAHAVLARIQFVYDWDWEAPEATFARALELNPNSWDTRTARAIYYVLTGREGPAFEDIERAIAIDPLSLGTQLYPGWANFTSGNYDRAIQELLKTIKLHPRYAFAWEELAWSYAAKGMAQEALAAADTATALTKKPLEDTITISGLAWVYAVSGRRDTATSLHERLLALSREKYVDDWYLAQTYSALGEIDSAFACIERSIERRSPSVVFMQVTPEFRPLHDDPRYEPLMRRVGIPED